MSFADAFTRLVGHEGGYANNPQDPGGETMWGITARVARASGYTGPMRDLPMDTARAICKRHYWDTLRLDELPANVAFQILDANYHGGHVVTWMQQACDADGSLSDGIFRPDLLVRIRRMDSRTFIMRFLSLRLNYLTCCRPWPTFSRGWARRIAANLMTGAQP